MKNIQSTKLGNNSVLDEFYFLVNPVAPIYIFSLHIISLTIAFNYGTNINTLY